MDLKRKSPPFFIELYLKSSLIAVRRATDPGLGRAISVVEERRQSVDGGSQESVYRGVSDLRKQFDGALLRLCQVDFIG